MVRLKLGLCMVCGNLVRGTRLVRCGEALQLQAEEPLAMGNGRNPREMTQVSLREGQLSQALQPCMVV